MKDSKQSSLLWNDVDIGHTGRQLGMDEELLGNLPPDVAETREIDGDEDFSVLFPDDEATLKQLPRDSGTAPVLEWHPKKIKPMTTLAQ